jgi:DNA (cytosine-5)-methyltransferase 1
LRVLDLYAGVGGWAVGFKLAGFEITKSYEWWQPAAETHHANSSSDVLVGDIRKLNFASLPKNIDIVIGSPPCTQFSYSNRGGSGDISDGLVDLEQFLKVVRHTEPKAWAFENVPRVKSVLERELAAGGSLEEYADLFEHASMEIFDISQFGVPQRRKRCIAGNFDFKLLKSYAHVTERPTLGDVISGLSEGRDPIFAASNLEGITDNEPEEPLNWEEERFNRDMKVAHPIYNGMPFPDPFDRSSRTVTATCTRVSRESLVIKDGNTSKYRRLSVRERASLQSFPVKFQFLGRSHAQKLKMIGNAIPPAFTYLIGEAMKGTSKNDLRLASEIDANALLPGHPGIITRPDNSGKTYPLTRRFRFSIPELRFKSGTRFELSNASGPEAWEVAFYFGDSKRIRSHKFQRESVACASRCTSKILNRKVHNAYKKLERMFGAVDLIGMQATWNHTGAGLHPFKFIDGLGDFVNAELKDGGWSDLEISDLQAFVFSLVFPDPKFERIAEKKISRFLVEIAIGSIVAAFLNDKLEQNHSGKSKVEA